MMVIGYCSTCYLSYGFTCTAALQDKEFVNSVLEKINADSLRSFLKTLSKEPHIAASERDK
jgi:hypothetical protein